MFQGGCVSTWDKQGAEDRQIDREVACLAALGLLYVRYAKSHGRAHGTFEQALLVYDYTVLQLPGVKPWLDEALLGLDRASPAPSPAPADMRSIEALADEKVRPVDYLQLHSMVRDAFGRDIGVLLTSCKGFSYPGDGMPACFPFPLYPPEGPDRGQPLAPNLVGAIAACQYSPQEPDYRPNSTEYNCGQAGIPFWISYLLTGDEGYWSLLASIRDIYRSKGGGTGASAVIIANTGCYASWVLAPGTQTSCGD